MPLPLISGQISLLIENPLRACRFRWTLRICSSKAYTGTCTSYWKIPHPGSLQRFLSIWIPGNGFFINSFITERIIPKTAFLSIRFIPETKRWRLPIANVARTTAPPLFIKKCLPFFSTISHTATGKSSISALCVKNSRPWHRITAITFSNTAWKTMNRLI